MLGGLGFIDTLNQTSVNHNSGVIAWFANPYAAMPSLHTAYAVIIGCAGILVFSHALLKVIWALYPGLVVFSIIATANHWFLDATIGAFVALFALLFAFAVSRGTVPTLGALGRAKGAKPPAYASRAPDAVPQRA